MHRDFIFVACRMARRITVDLSTGEIIKAEHPLDRYLGYGIFDLVKFLRPVQILPAEDEASRDNGKDRTSTI